MAIVTALLCLAAPRAPATPAGPPHESIHSIEAIRAAATKFVRDLIPGGAGAAHVEAAHLDSRLRLGACAHGLRSSLASGGGLRARTTVAVACEGPTPWRIFVPVAIETEIEVLVLRRMAARGETLAAGDVEIRKRRVPGLAHAYVTDTASIEGRQLRRGLAPGATLTVEALAPVRIVKRGQQVTLLASIGTIEVRAPGVALADGGAAERVRVQNAASLKVVEGVVENASIIRVSP